MSKKRKEENAIVQNQFNSITIREAHGRPANFAKIWKRSTMYEKYCELIVANCSGVMIRPRTRSFKLLMSFSSFSSTEKQFVNDRTSKFSFYLCSDQFRNERISMRSTMDDMFQSDAMYKSPDREETTVRIDPRETFVALLFLSNQKTHFVTHFYTRMNIKSKIIESDCWNFSSQTSC